MAATLFATPTPHTAFDQPLYSLYSSHPAVNGCNVPHGVHVISPPANQCESPVGRKLGPTPRRLHNRILYIPAHGDKVTHLPIYDFTRQYREAVRDEPIGTSRFKTKLGLMHKPHGDGRSGTGEVSYLVDFEAPEARRDLTTATANTTANNNSNNTTNTTHATVQRRSLYGGAEVGLAIPQPQHAGLADDCAAACTVTPSSTGAYVNLARSYPLRPTVTRLGSSRNPWFTFTVPGAPPLGGGDDGRTLQWQVHPAEHGLLRYTLVELPRGRAADEMWWEDSSRKDDGAILDEKVGGGPAFSAAVDGNEHRIRAIYHNVGLGFSLAQPFSEGALLLQDGMDPEFEAVVVASLLGMLWRARGEGRKSRKGSKSEGSALARKKSGSVTSGDEDGSVSPGSSPSRKGFLGKILRRLS
ncbi:hypothetical protein VPNG_02495 [Cytospora leucostoma]|uniref:Uncharacterized protein n=1 Tax=Cytospora leucostoma TaxID=1230097 RepID=A0A423XHY9_9PEZI|nr:hypothetical protein VPNG_02495 [Cytospora leucostoma]